MVQMMINPLKKYLTLHETIDYINNRLALKSIPRISYIDFIDFCKQDMITPLFLFNGFAVEPFSNENKYSKIKAYVTSKDLAFNLIESHSLDDDNYFQFSFAKIQEFLRKDSDLFEEFDEVFLFANTPFSEKNRITSIEQSALRFSQKEIDSFLESNGIAGFWKSNNIPETSNNFQIQINQLQQRVAELETQNQLKDDRIAELESQTTENRMMLKGLDLVNHDKEKAQLFANVIAKSVWQMDTTKQIKSGDMVQYIKSLLLQFDSKSLPQTDETISDWLKEIKPDYAKQGGRTPKDAPTEIPLTFKK